jgi:hypothetical protein
MINRRLTERRNKMKKLLTILLVLLVAGFAFAADPTPLAGDASLILKSSVKGITVHGFYVDDQVEGDEIFDQFNVEDFTESVEVVGADVTVVNLDMNSTTATSIANYSFITNSALGLAITIAGGPLALDVSETSGTPLYVPYQLDFLASNGSSYGDKTFKGTADLVPSNSDENMSFNATLVTDSSVGSIKWGTYDVKVTFGAGASYSFPEGEYEATVTATITTI